MRKMLVMVTKYGYAVVEAEKEETALQKSLQDGRFRIRLVESGRWTGFGGCYGF